MLSDVRALRFDVASVIYSTEMQAALSLGLVRGNKGLRIKGWQS